MATGQSADDFDEKYQIKEDKQNKGEDILVDFLAVMGGESDTDSKDE